MTEIKFNNKVINYQKLLLAQTKGVTTELEINEKTINHTTSRVFTNGNKSVENNIVFYIFEGNPVILLGLELYRQYLRDGVTKVKAKMFTKHSLAAFENNVKYTLTTDRYNDDSSYNPNTFARTPRSVRQVNNSGGVIINTQKPHINYKTIKSPKSY